MKTRKELKQDHKQRKSQMGVCQIKNVNTGRVFIDYSTDVNAKWNRHLSELRFGSHRNKTLQKDWKQFGESAFKFEILSEMEYQDDSNPDYNKELKTLQQLIVEELDSSISVY